MKSLILLFSLLLASCSPLKPVRLLPALRSETVALVSDSSIRCTGVWLSNDTIITAGHCLISEMPIDLPGLDEDEDGDEITVSIIQDEVKISTFSEIGEINEAPKATHHGVRLKLDKQLDLALIKVDGVIPPHKNIVLAKHLPEIGDPIVILGHPAGCSFTFQQGYVSAYRDGLSSLGFTAHIMQLQGPIFGGDSGAGIFNAKGEMVGIVSAFAGKDIPDIGFGISLATINSFIK
jgi:hypothetical protein